MIGGLDAFCQRFVSNEDKAIVSITVTIPRRPAVSFRQEQNNRILLQATMLQMDMVKIASNLSSVTSRSCSDVTITCLDQSWPVHRIILCTRSSVMEKMLMSEMKEAKERVIQIENQHPHVVDAMIKHIYGQALDCVCDDGDGFDFYTALALLAEQYDLKPLVQFCVGIMSYFITDKSIVRALILANQINSGILKDACYSFGQATTNKDMLEKICTDGQLTASQVWPLMSRPAGKPTLSIENSNMARAMSACLTAQQVMSVTRVFHDLANKRPLGAAESAEPPAKRQRTEESKATSLDDLL